MSPKKPEPDEYQVYLEDKHSRLNTPPELIDQMVKKAIGSVPLSTRKLILGEVNEVYEAAGPDGKFVIVRISRRNYPEFESERWAIEQCLKVGVPAPKVLLVDSIINGEEKLAVSVEDRLKGEPLNSLHDQLRQSELESLVKNAGEILGKIHSVKTTKYGHVNSLGVGLDDKWTETMLRAEKDLDKLYNAAARTDVPKNLIDKALEILRDNVPLYERATPHLLHTDYGPKHILVDSGKISGILDFEGCKSGDPVWDFAWWDFFQTPRLPTQWLKEGYGDKNVFNADFNKRLLLVRLNLGLSLLEYYESEKNPSGVRHTKNQLSNDINLIV